MKKLFYLLSLLIIASMVLTACGGAATEAPADEPAAPADEPAAPAAQNITLRVLPTMSTSWTFLFSPMRLNPT